MGEKEEKKEKEEIEQKEEKGEKEEEEEKQETLTEAWSPPGARPLHLEPSCPHSARAAGSPGSSSATCISIRTSPMLTR